MKEKNEDGNDVKKEKQEENKEYGFSTIINSQELFNSNVINYRNSYEFFNKKQDELEKYNINLEAFRTVINQVFLIR
jgi:hypothetical protein